MFSPTEPIFSMASHIVVESLMHWILNFLWLWFYSKTSSNFLIHWLLPPRDSYGLDKKRMTSTAYNEILSRLSNIFMPSTLLLCWILWLICSRVMVKREGKKGHHCLLLLDKIKTSEQYPLFLTVGSNTMSLFKKVLDHYVRLPKLSSSSFLSANQMVLQHIMLINKYLLYFHFAKVCNLVYVHSISQYNDTLLLYPHCSRYCHCSPISNIYCLLTYHRNLIYMVLEKVQESS